MSWEKKKKKRERKRERERKAVFTMTNKKEMKH